MATAEGPEVSTLQKHFLDLQGAIIRGDVPAALFQYGVISSDGLSHATNETVPPKKRGRDTALEVLDAVRLNPALFKKVCDALEVEKDVTGEIIHNIQGNNG